MLIYIDPEREVKHIKDQEKVGTYQIDVILHASKKILNIISMCNTKGENGS